MCIEIVPHKCAFSKMLNIHLESFYKTVFYIMLTTITIHTLKDWDSDCLISALAQFPFKPLLTISFCCTNRMKGMDGRKNVLFATRTDKLKQHSVNDYTIPHKHITAIFWKASILWTMLPLFLNLHSTPAITHFRELNIMHVMTRWKIVKGNVHKIAKK